MVMMVMVMVSGDGAGAGDGDGDGDGIVERRRSTDLEEGDETVFLTGEGSHADVSNVTKKIARVVVCEVVVRRRMESIHIQCFDCCADEKRQTMSVRSEERSKERRKRDQTWGKGTDVSLSVATFRDKDEGRIKVLGEIRPKDVGAFKRSIRAIDGVSNGDVGARDDVKDENVGGSDEFPFVALSVIDVE